LYREIVVEWDRVLKPGGRAVVLVHEQELLLGAIRKVGWGAQRQYRIRVLGLPATLSVWRKREAN
jgi:ubiquinone/menaquinone biosynthesis C-methylase UbiE